MKQSILFVVLFFLFGFSRVVEAQTHDGNQLSASCQLADPILVIRSRAAVPSQIGLVIERNRVVTGLISEGEIRRGISVSFTVRLRRGFDSFLLVHREVRAKVIKTDFEYGVTLLAIEETPGEMILPVFAEKSAREGIVRWPDARGSSFPYGYVLGDFSKALGDEVVNGAPLFNAERQLIGLIVRKQEASPPTFVPVEAIRKLIR